MAPPKSGRSPEQDASCLADALAQAELQPELTTCLEPAASTTELLVEFAVELEYGSVRTSSKTTAAALLQCAQARLTTKWSQLYAYCASTRALVQLHCGAQGVRGRSGDPTHYR